MSDKNKTNNKYVTDDERERGKRIKELFDGLGITGEKFDEKYGLKIIDENGEEKDNPDGISYNTMKTHFAGKGLNIKNLVKYSKIFGVSADYILFGGEKSAPIKEEPKDENKFELKKINEALVLLMDIFGDDSVSYYDENINCAAHIEINIETPQIVDNARSIKNLRSEIRKSNNEDTKKWLSYGLFSTINAENMVVESVDNKIFVYDKIEEIIFHGYVRHGEGLIPYVQVINNKEIKDFEYVNEAYVSKHYNNKCHCKFGYDERGHYISTITLTTSQDDKFIVVDDEDIPF